jgi:hypothetical protein
MLSLTRSFGNAHATTGGQSALSVTTALSAPGEHTYVVGRITLTLFSCRLTSVTRSPPHCSSR